MASRPADRLRALLIAGLITLGPGATASATLRVVATFPDVADIAREIGGERVAVETLAGGSQDPHRVPMKPSFVTKLNRADALVVMGLGLEEAFLPGLLEAARNAKINPGGEAYVDASLYVPTLEVPSSLDRSQGELHPLGNPHVNLDPVRGKLLAKGVADGLSRVDPDGAALYQANLARYAALLDERIAGWERLAAPLRGLKIVSYHADLVYLADRYGFEVVGTIETKPGIAPTPGHLEALAARMKETGVTVVVREVAYDPPLARALAERTGARLATLSVLTGGLPNTPTYVDFVDANIRALVAAATGD